MLTAQRSNCPLRPPAESPLRSNVEVRQGSAENENADGAGTVAP